MKELCKILIVDDEVLVRQGIKHYLVWEQYGFQIIGEASNGREALDLIDELQPHIVITDIVMPVMDGEEFTRIVKQNYPQIEVIVLSSYGEFSYVRSTFQSGVADYILKPKLETQELLQVLQNTARRIPSLAYDEAAGDEQVTVDHIIEKLIAGYEMDYDPQMIAVHFPYDRYTLVGIQPQQLRVSGNELTLQQKSSYVSAISSRLAESIESAGVPVSFRPVAADPQLIVFLLNMNTGDEAAVISRVRELAHAGRAEDQQTIWAMSEAFANVDQLGSVYQQLLKLLEYHFYFPDRHFMMEAELGEPVPLPGAFNLKQFAEEMRRENFDSAFAELDTYVQAMAGNYRATPFELKSFLGNIIFNIITLLGNQDYDVRQLDEEKYDYFREINDAIHVQDTIAVLHEFLSRVHLQIQSRSSQNGSANMKMLLEYIEEHYAEPLSLTGLGQHFHFNPSYLSSYFTTHNKEGFSEHLNKIRVEKAAEMLRTDVYSISEISGKVGYSDHSYFTKVFKKWTGLSPSQYRRQHVRG
ncbi:response regulator transcription factor [Paenibacillus bovis]|uniref:Two-component system response regulator n=1 Tax=Paenibacillus bovis TaxID=1616788 RepID=A0A172ZCL0_9BACL|nr:response regulator transcription factor [Paenibacillus bovis]ANF95259.1 two-component system response regulator [Paenibacillus bovis]